ncbi:hypothetical protein LZ554_006364 [Drepanopeziza brunnea f. sp. 'monogermtubi']|nr:hypothetical protein LZ554_006364 [Drepanopeziza brunnea f. sp. 'monogermtubi']
MSKPPRVQATDRTADFQHAHQSKIEGLFVCGSAMGERRDVWSAELTDVPGAAAPGTPRAEDHRLIANMSHPYATLPVEPSRCAEISEIRVANP